jgi:acylaminoacyl-peptidase
MGSSLLRSFPPCFCILWLATPAFAGDGPDPERFSMRDVFELEFASDPRISPDGRQVVYARNFMDIMTDRQRSNLWIVNTDGSDHRPLTTGIHNDSAPRWSPDGTRIAYVSDVDGRSQLYCRWIDTGQVARLTNLTSSPAGLSWSPDGRWLAFSMLVPEERKPFAELPAKPDGAEWAQGPRLIERLIYRHDGSGYLPDGYRQLFVVPAEGGTPRQLTHGNFHHDGGPVWSPDSRSLLFSSNRDPDWEYQPEDSEIYEVPIDSSEITALTDRDGPDHSPVISPDGTQIAWLGFDDRRQGYQVTRLSVMTRDGSGKRLLSGDVDRSLASPRWSADGQSLLVQYDDFGTTKIGRVTLDGEFSEQVAGVGGVTIGRPYASGSYTIAETGAIAFTMTHPDRPADVAVLTEDGNRPLPLTQLNQDLLGHKRLGDVSEFRVRTSVDDREIQGWIVRPPDFDPSLKYPLILEIHGGPFANYGPRFSAEMQLYAAAGYVVLYVNPRGSTGYGEEFGNLIHHAYPGDDFHDLMSAVDAILAEGDIDEDNLFVTGGSGGGVLTAWIVGHTDRFRAAVAAKPVINWYSFVLTADAYNFFHEYWFPGYPWDHPEHYLARSPLAHVGNVTTPTMLITGEQDYRTPISESEQFYQALKLRRVDTILVRIPGASHNIAARPSRMITKVAHVLEWFERHRASDDAGLTR